MPSVQFSSVQSLSRVQHFVTPWNAALQASLSITNSWSLLKPMSIESVMPSNHLILCHPFLLLPSVFPSIRIYFNESALHITWPKYSSFSFSISPSNNYAGLISFKIDWFDLLAVQGTLKSLLQYHSSKASILRPSAFFTVQLSHPYMTTGKTIYIYIYSYSVTQLCPVLCDPMDCSMPGFPVHHLLPELAQTHVHRVIDAIQPSHCLSSPSPSALSLSQHQSFNVDKALENFSASSSSSPKYVF